MEEGKIFHLTGYCEKMKIYLYEQLLQERSKKQGQKNIRGSTNPTDPKKRNKEFLNCRPNPFFLSNLDREKNSIDISFLALSLVV